MAISYDTAAMAAKSNIVTLNVGGMLYDTTLDTLKNASSGSMLARLVECLEAELVAAEQSRPGPITSSTSPAMRDSKGHLFIDRDGPMFRHILRYLRSAGEIPLPSDMDTCLELLQEAEFFQLAELVSSLKAHIEHKETCKKRKAGYVQERGVKAVEGSLKQSQLLAARAELEARSNEKMEVLSTDSEQLTTLCGRVRHIAQRLQDRYGRI